jgi:holo-[acyl-carrier protein] synthase
MNIIQHTTGIGCDIEEIERFCLDRNSDAAFLQRIFTSPEIEYCYSFQHPAPHLAARFCAREAVVKALSSVGDDQVDYRNIEINKYPSGVPYVTIHPEEPTNPGKKYDICLTISHCNTTAMAVVLITRKAGSDTDGN